MVCTLWMPCGASNWNPEVAEWLESLPEGEFGHAEFYIDLLETHVAEEDHD